MIFKLVDNETCANLTESYGHHLQGATKTIALSLILTYIIGLNLAVILVTIGSAKLRGCLFSMQSVASYVGNIFAASSFIGNDIYYSRRGILPICQKGVDHYAFLYLGLSINMVVLGLNTWYRFKGVYPFVRERASIFLEKKM